MGHLQDLRVRDDAQAQKHSVVSEVLRVTGEQLGAGGHEAVPDSQGTRPADGGDPPDRQQSSQFRHRGTDKKPEAAQVNPRVPVQKQQARVEIEGRIGAYPSDNVLA